MKITFRLICIISAIFAISSCKSDDTLQYNNYTMGNIVNGTFISDQGNIFTVVEKNCTGDLESMKRAIILCDVLKQVEGTENEYEIRLNNLAEVLVKDPITKEAAAEDPEKTVEDPIHIEQCWISGGYINMYLMYTLKAGSTQKHLVNLVLDESASQAGKYDLTLRHNSFGDSSADSSAQILLGGAYVSFPITEMITEDSAEISLNWKWYKSAGAGWSSEVQDNSVKISYTKGGYEQAPAALSSKATTNIN